MGLEGPEDLEQLAIKKINSGELKEGLKLMLRAAKGYEEEGKAEDAARLFKYLGYVLLERTGSIEKARPSLLKSAYLYLDLIDREISKPDVDIDTLDEYCFSVLEIFATLNDQKNLEKYAEEFAGIYEELGNSYQENDDLEIAIRAYETAYRYYKLMGNEEAYKRIAETLITLYGQVAESRLESGDTKGAAKAFYHLAGFTRAIFGYDIHFIEMMDTAAKNFEKASKTAYSNGDLDGTTSCLVKAQYAYLLARNFNRAKLIGLNTARMLYQVISSHRSRGDYEKAAEKLVELSEALIGIGKLEEAMGAYKSALETRSTMPARVRVRIAVLKKFAAENSREDVLDDIENIEYYLGRNKHTKALELAEKAMRRDGLVEVLEKIHAAEGYG
ncbi:hypothetical protein [Thermococcus sp. MV11]|uniref:hypothetical protein n=1 Tax=Thermococcus sp. MV11 TaxID=1638267 RepID=UPI00143050BE|nr:hypothetical protein [Thermococcus sp. MV11]NJE02609.1 hypothetical protein [Thermococcus sp. MV11]